MRKTLLALALAALGGAGLFAAPACCATNLTAGTPLPDRSIYQIESRWTSDYGKEIRLEKLRGEPRLLTMFFASCEYACPILVNDMSRIDAALQAAGVTNVGLTLVTFDSERDTVAALRAFRQTRKLDDRWTLLRGGPDDVMELAALLGIKYKKDARGQFAHSNVILLLDADGQVVHQQAGLNQDPAETVAAARRLAGEISAPATP